MERTFKCYLCPVEYENERFIISHLKKEHFIQNDTVEMKCVVKGNSCEERFYKFNLLKNHMKRCCDQNNESKKINAVVRDAENISDRNVEIASVLFEKKLVIDQNVNQNRDNCFSLNPTSIETSDTVTPESNNFFLKNKETNSFGESELDRFLDYLKSTICNLSLSHHETTTIYKLFLELVENSSKFNLHLIKEKNGFSALNALEFSSKLICNKFTECSSQYKRAKQFESNPLYVAPHELVIGLRHDMSKSQNFNVAVPRLIQCKYHYVPITSTIISLFQRPDFKKAYFDYNRSIGQRSVDGIYTDFSSGSRFKSSELFSRYPNSLQIELSTDDFDVCNGLGSKASMHKLCPVYVSIKNLPPEFTSRLDSISLASLCYTDDMTTKFTDFNDIWRMIVKDVSIIENGIDIGGEELRGTIIHVKSDNLGVHQAYGLVKNFSKTEYCCRFCTCSRSEMKTLCKEIPSKRRTIEHYNEQIKIINDSTKVNLRETFGIVRYSVLNDLSYFHIMTSMVPEIMHDINCGTGPFLVKNFIENLIEKKVFSEKEIKEKIQYFDYGWKNRNNIPSDIGLQKRSIGQNAVQMLCLLQHFPFIFYQERNHPEIKEKWITIKSMLHILQIVYSTRIDENDLQSLEDWTEIHLRTIQDLYGIQLLPKHHYMTHNPEKIRENGCIKHVSMIRSEAKHKVLKSYAEESKCFINITKTIAVRHQQQICLSQNVYVDRITHGKIKKVETQFFYENENIFKANNIEESEIFEVSWLNYNSFDYRENILICSEGVLYQIKKVFVHLSEYFFFCIRFDVVKYEEFLNSIEIKQSPVDSVLIKFSSLENKHNFEAKYLQEKMYIILDTLNLKYVYDSYQNKTS